MFERLSTKFTPVNCRSSNCQLQIVKSQLKKQIPTTLIGHSDFRVLEILSGRYEQFQGRKFIEPHRRNIYSFFYVKTGYIRHSIDFRTETCKAGNVFFMAPHQVYLVDSASNFGGISINCKAEWLHSDELHLPIIRNVQQYNLLKLTGEQSSYLGGLLSSLLKEFNQPELFSEQILRSYFTVLLAYLSRIYQQLYNKTQLPGERTDILEKFWPLIDTHWKDFTKIDDYAKHLFISGSQLNRILKENTGKSAMEWVQEKKMTEARRMLLYSDYSIKEIAYESGFDDPAYFNRFFKKWNLGTPQQFRDEMRKKYNKNL